MIVAIRKPHSKSEILDSCRVVLFLLRSTSPSSSAGSRLLPPLPLGLPRADFLACCRATRYCRPISSSSSRPTTSCAWSKSSSSSCSMCRPSSSPSTSRRALNRSSSREVFSSRPSTRRSANAPPAPSAPTRDSRSPPAAADRTPPSPRGGASGSPRPDGCVPVDDLGGGPATAVEFLQQVAKLLVVVADRLENIHSRPFPPRAVRTVAALAVGILHPRLHSGGPVAA